MNRGEATDLILDSALAPPERLVLLAYMSHLPSDRGVEVGRAWPGLGALQRRSGFGRTAVIRARQSLVDAGLLVQTGLTDRGGLVMRLDLSSLREGVRETDGSARRTGPRDGRVRETDGSARRTGRGPRGGRVGVRQTDPNPPQGTLLNEPSSEEEGLAPPSPPPVEEISAESEPDPPPSATWAPAFDFELGAGVDAAELNEGIIRVFAFWQERQITPTAWRLTRRRLDLLRAAITAHGAPQVEMAIRLAYEAPVGEHGLPKRFADSWRGASGTEPPGLAMLLHPDRVERNVELAMAWASGAPAAATETDEEPEPWCPPGWLEDLHRELEGEAAEVCMALAGHLLRDGRAAPGFAAGSVRQWADAVDSAVVLAQWPDAEVLAGLASQRLPPDLWPPTSEVRAAVVAALRQADEWGLTPMAAR